MKKTTARVLITKECNRNCDYCCNKYTAIMKQMKEINNIWQLMDYSNICITGGEPLLNPKRTLNIIRQIRYAFPYKTIYLYTARFLYPPDRMEPIVEEVDGVHFTIHSETAFVEYHCFDLLQDWLYTKYVYYNDYKKSFRLYVHPQAEKIRLIPKLWARVEVKPWLEEHECCLPEHEDLFFYNP